MTYWAIIQLILAVANFGIGEKPNKVALYVSVMAILFLNSWRSQLTYENPKIFEKNREGVNFFVTLVLILIFLYERFL